MEIGSVDSKLPPVAATTSAIPVEARAEQQQLIKAVKAIDSAHLFGQNTELTFALDRQTKRPVVRILDAKTREVIRQIPPEYVLRMAEDLREANGK